MSDSKYSGISTSYRNGELVGAVNTQYRELININPDAVPYIDKLSPTSFFAKTRKGYVGSVIPAIGDLSNYGTMINVTDIVKIDTTGCGGGDCYWLYYQVSDDRSRFRVVRRECDNCTQLTVVQEGYRCPCDSDKFFKLDFPIGTPTLEGIGQQQVINILDHRFNSNDFISAESGGDVQVGDYVVFNSSSDSLNPGVCGIYRQIQGVYDGYISLDSAYTQINAENRIGDNVGFKIFRNYGKTVGWVGNMSLNIYSGSSDSVTTMCGTRGGCLISVVNHNGIINVLTDKGYNSYGGIGEDILFFNGLNTVHVGTDKFSTVSFGDFLVTMGPRSMVAVVFDDTGKYAYKYDVSSASYEEFGLYSRNAYGVLDNALYVIGNDKRLYIAKIEGNTKKYYLTLTTQSTTIFPDLDLIQPSDEVSISSYQNKLYIFINGRSNTENDYTDKTKILIYNGDYKFRYKHIVPRGVINGTKYGLFFGAGIFQTVGDRDIYQYGDSNNNYYLTSPIKTEITFDIVNSENHGITNSLGNRVSLMTNKSLNWMKMLLGPGRYTDNTYINITSYTNGYKFTKKITGIDNEWIDNRNNYMDGNYEGISVSKCFSEMLSKCDNMNNPCEDSKFNTDVKEELESPICWLGNPDMGIKFEPHRFDDYAICYDDKAYQLSPIKHVWINPQMKYDATLYTISIVSDNYDSMNYGGAIVEYNSFPIGYREKTGFDLEPACCNKQPKCPNENCS